jgi:hypothetical protein
MGVAAASLSEALVPTARDSGTADRTYDASLKLLERCRKLSNPIT